MIENPEELEKQVEQRQEAQRNLHRNFRPEDSSDSEDARRAEAEAIKERQRQAGAGAKFQGDIGEGVGLRMTTERLGLTPDPRFDQSTHGFDIVCKEGKDKLVVVESKFDKRGIRALNGDQMQPEWVERTAQKMRIPGNEQFTQGNAEIGTELLDAGPEKVRRLVVTTNPETLEVRVYEGQPDRTWKQIDAWNAWELEQPYLKD